MAVVVFALNAINVPPADFANRSLQSAANSRKNTGGRLYMTFGQY
ncbi:MAG TPA: hypothetical protein VIS74_00570 [Chthoniobacterales bacterium]